MTVTGKGRVRRFGSRAAKTAVLVPAAFIALVALIVIAFGGVSAPTRAAVVANSPSIGADERWGDDFTELAVIATDGTDVPWNVPAAIAIWATDAGLRSPYPGDTLRRGREAGTGRIPLVEPAIRPGVYGPAVPVPAPPKPSPGGEPPASMLFVVDDLIDPATIVAPAGATVAMSVTTAVTTTDVATAITSAATPPELIVVAVGALNAGSDTFTADLAAVRAAAPTATIRWVVPDRVDSTVSRPALTTAATASSIELVDWAAEVERNPTWRGNDGVHLSVIGVDYYRQWLTAMIPTPDATPAPSTTVPDPDVVVNLTELDDPYGFDRGGSGVVLLNPDLLEGMDLDPQDTEVALKALTGVIEELARLEAAERRVSLQDMSNPADLASEPEVQAFWIGIVDQIAVEGYTTSWSDPQPGVAPTGPCNSIASGPFTWPTTVVKLVPCPPPPVITVTPDPPAEDAPTDTTTPPAQGEPVDGEAPPEPERVRDPNSVPVPPPAPGQAVIRIASQIVGEGSAITVGVATGTIAGIDPTAMAAYQAAWDWVATNDPTCKIPVTMIAAVGSIESNHAGTDGGNGTIAPNGDISPRVYGPPLDGTGVGGNRTPYPNNLTADEKTFFGVTGQYLQAVGPMQFLPGTWKSLGVDNNGDQIADPQNYFDATASTSRYLCRAGTPMITEGDWRRGLHAYNAPTWYADKVIAKHLEYQAALASSGGFGVDLTGLPDAPVGYDQVVRVRGIAVHKSIAPNIESLLAAAEADGLRMSGGGWRDSAAQIAVRNANCGCGGNTDCIYNKPSGDCRPPAARPGKSMHERGLAIDFTCNGTLIGTRSNPCYLWLASNAGTYGLKNLPSEPWHWSTNGN